MRLIDADALVGAIRHDADQTPDSNWGYGLNHAVVIVRSQLIVDAVPVVRCKDCKYRGNSEKCVLSAISEEKDVPLFMLDNSGGWFCADGERRDAD